MRVKMIVAAFCLLFALVKATMVELHSEWRPDFGWQVTCTWKLYANDSLQSVRLYRKDQQFMIYRPERDGPRGTTNVQLPDSEFRADCDETVENGVTGKCILAMEIFQPLRDDLSYTCEVSGERPTFRVESKTVNVEALVPPSDAVVKTITQNEQSSERVMVNCSSTGLPTPNLVWTIGDQNIPSDFSGGMWNVTSKLYHVWSSLSYTPADSNSHAICTPEIIKSGRILKGRPAQYNGAEILQGATTVIIGVLTTLALTR